MHRKFRRPLVRAVLSILALSGALAPAFAAGKEDAPGQMKKQGAESRPAQPAPREVRIGAYFELSDRNAARVFYEQSFQRTGSCPPGLAKKNNGCQPPGQAKAYAVGRPLPGDVVVYPVAQGVLVRLPPAPAGHKYVRVAADILLIAIGTQMVVDAITDLGR